MSWSQAIMLPLDSLCIFTTFITAEHTLLISILGDMGNQYAGNYVEWVPDVCVNLVCISI